MDVSENGFAKTILISKYGVKHCIIESLCSYCLHTPLPIPTFLFFSKTIFENLILDIYICPFFKILETFINWNEKQGIWGKSGFLHDGLKKIGSHSFCEHTFFWRFPDNLPLCQYFPLLRVILGGSSVIILFYIP